VSPAKWSGRSGGWEGAWGWLLALGTGREASCCFALQWHGVHNSCIYNVVTIFVRLVVACRCECPGGGGAQDGHGSARPPAVRPLSGLQSWVLSRTADAHAETTGATREHWVVQQPCGLSWAGSASFSVARALSDDVLHEESRPSPASSENVYANVQPCHSHGWVKKRYQQWRCWNADPPVVLCARRSQQLPRRAHAQRSHGLSET
jgi:hypothetical protein